MNAYFGPVVKDQPVVAIDRVRYVGEVIAAVAAEGRDIAEEALDLIEVEYEPLPAVFDPVEAMKPEAPVLHDRKTKIANLPGEKRISARSDGNVLSTYHVEEGDVGVGFRESDEIFEDVYTSPKIQHGHIEPHAAVAYWEPSGKLVIYTSTQTPSSIRAQLAELFDLPQSKVRVIVPFVGGGYGAKTHPRLEPLICGFGAQGAPTGAVGVDAGRSVSDGSLSGRSGEDQDRSEEEMERSSHARSKRIYDAGAYALTSTNTARNGGEVSGGRIGSSIRI